MKGRNTDTQHYINKTTGKDYPVKLQHSSDKREQEVAAVTAVN